MGTGKLLLVFLFPVPFILGNSHSEYSWPSDYGILYIRLVKVNNRLDDIGLSAIGLALHNSFF